MRTLIAALLLSLSAAATAAAPLVLAFDELPPWKVRQGDGFGGMYVELARELARRVDRPLEIVECPLKRCLQLLESGGADMIIGLRDSPDRRRFLHFLSTPYRRSSADKVFYTLRDKAIRIDTYQDLAPLRIGHRFGAEIFPRFDADTSLHKDSARDVATCLQKLQLGRVDVVVVPEDQGEAALGQLHGGPAIIKASYRISDPSPRAVGFAKASRQAALLPALEQAMAAIARDGTLANLYEVHYYRAWHVSPQAIKFP